MEDRLQKLIEGYKDPKRTQWALEWKNRGGKVIGFASAYVPEEVLHAAGILPWRIVGAWHRNTPNAGVYRPDYSCGYCTNVLESVLAGELDFLDGLIIPDEDQDMLRLWDVLVALRAKPFCHSMHIPYVVNDRSYQFLTGEIRRLISKIEDFSEAKITDDALRSSIHTYNKMRDLLGSMYELRKREIPPLTGAEALGIALSAQVMPKELFNEELSALLPFIENRRANLKSLHPRILLSSEMLDEPAYVSLIEEGGLVAMDDMDTGSRYFGQNVDTSLEDPAHALARRYISRHGSPRMSHWEEQIAEIKQRVNDFKIDGVITLPLVWCYPQRFRAPLLNDRLREAGIPTAIFEREYQLANAGQLRTRIGAFLETLEVKR